MPEKITWSEAIETGVTLVDLQHKYLIDIINELAEAINSGEAGIRIGKILNLLKYYTEWHFGREELCMEKHACPVAAKNKKAHGHFMDTFEGFQQEYRASGGSLEIAERMYRVLTEWLVSHIQGVDTELGPCVHRRA